MDKCKYYLNIDGFNATFNSDKELTDFVKNNLDKEVGVKHSISGDTLTQSLQDLTLNVLEDNTARSNIDPKVTNGLTPYSFIKLVHNINGAEKLLSPEFIEENYKKNKLALLKGIKKVILGNHDFPQHVPELLKYVNSVCSSYKEKNCILTHIPIHPFEMNRYRKNIHGHVHENTIDDDRYVNVSCEVIDYTPQLLNNYIL